MFGITVDGWVQQAKADERLIDVINRNGAKLPQVCYHPQLGPIQTCDTCMVEVDASLLGHATNYYPERDGKFEELDSDQSTSSELMASHLKEARLVKGFDTIYFKHLASQGDASLPLEDRRAIFIASDDSEAKGSSHA